MVFCSLTRPTKSNNQSRASTKGPVRRSIGRERGRGGGKSRQMGGGRSRTVRPAFIGAGTAMTSWRRIGRLSRTMRHGRVWRDPQRRLSRHRRLGPGASTIETACWISARGVLNSWEVASRVVSRARISCRFRGTHWTINNNGSRQSPPCGRARRCTRHAVLRGQYGSFPLPRSAASGPSDISDGLLRDFRESACLCALIVSLRGVAMSRTSLSRTITSSFPGRSWQGTTGAGLTNAHHPFFVGTVKRLLTLRSL
jgi:hypothetical protein